MFTILPKDFVNEDGTIKDGAREAAAADHTGPKSVEDDKRNETEALKEAQEKLGHTMTEDDDSKTSSDDID